MIEILDTTLRDGAQSEYINFSLDDKIKVALALDELKIDIIEGGNPSANPKDALFFEKMHKLSPLKNSQLCAFGSTRHPKKTVFDDIGIKGLIECKAPIISLFGKTSKNHVGTILKTTPENNLLMIKESIEFLSESGRKVYFDAEHFFDAYKEDPSYALKCLIVAQDAGACCIVLCDTNGGTLPHEVYEITKTIVTKFSIPLGIHCHNDTDTAVANTLLAVKAGVTHIQGTIAGVGERCGNTNLSSVLPNLILKMNYATALKEDDIRGITPISRQIVEIMNVSISNNSPFVGYSAFAHKGGMHIDGVVKYTGSFEHIDPERVGNSRRFLLSDQTGRSGVFRRVKKIIPDIEKNDFRIQEILNKLKRRELKGYAYENADGSFALMTLDIFQKRTAFYEILDYHVLCNKNENETGAQAFIKLSVDKKTEITAAEGDGPVNAIDKALRKALSIFYPCIQKMYLKDFSVRVLDAGGTASTVRVLVQSTDGTHIWNTVGVSDNIIQACFKALCDAVDYQLTYFQ